MRARIVRIGNSQGVRIPKPLLEQAGLGEEIELEVEGDTIVIRASSAPRAGWAAAFADAGAAEEEGFLEGHVTTRFDAEEWEW